MKTKQRTLAVLLVLVIVLGGLLWFVSRSNAAEEAASSAAAEGSILLSSFAAGDVTRIPDAIQICLWRRNAYPKLRFRQLDAGG